MLVLTEWSFIYTTPLCGTLTSKTLSHGKICSNVCMFIDSALYEQAIYDYLQKYCIVSRNSTMELRSEIVYVTLNVIVQNLQTSKCLLKVKKKLYLLIRELHLGIT